MRDVLLTGKVFEAAKAGRRGKNVRQYDAVVLDAPPTGRIAQFLGVNSELAGLARMGPIKIAGRHGDDAVPVPADGRPPGHRAGGDAGAGDQRRHRRAARRRPPGRRGRGQHGAAAGPGRDGPGRRARRLASTPQDLAAELAAGGVEADDALVEGLLHEARDHAERRALEDAQRAIVGELGVPTYELPRLAGGVDLGGLYELAAELKRAGHGMTTARTRPRSRFGPLAATASKAPALDVDALLDDPRTGIIVCCGSGGVGKTTTSAALALRAAERGRKVVVLTIDPARRLAQSMGIEALDNTPRPVAGVDAASRRAPSTR